MRTRSAAAHVCILALAVFLWSCTPKTPTWKASSAEIAQDKVDIESLPEVVHVNVPPPH